MLYDSPVPVLRATSHITRALLERAPRRRRSRVIDTHTVVPVIPVSTRCLFTGTIVPVRIPVLNFLPVVPPASGMRQRILYGTTGSSLSVPCVAGRSLLGWRWGPGLQYMCIAQLGSGPFWVFYGPRDLSQIAASPPLLQPDSRRMAVTITNDQTDEHLLQRFSRAPS